MSLGQGDIGWIHSADIYRRAYNTLVQASKKYAQALWPPGDPRMLLLGHGQFGNVYTTRRADRVLKLTADATELILAKWFEERRRRRTYRGVVRVYDTRLVPLGRGLSRYIREHPSPQFNPKAHIHVTGRKRRGFKLQNWQYLGDYPVTLPTHIVAILREPLIATEGQLRSQSTRRALTKQGYAFDRGWTRAGPKLNAVADAADALAFYLLEEPGYTEEDAAEGYATLQALKNTPFAGWLAHLILTLWHEGLIIADLHEDNIGVTPRSYKAKQFVLLDFGLAISSLPLTLPAPLEGV